MVIEAKRRPITKFMMLLTAGLVILTHPIAGAEDEAALLAAKAVGGALYSEHGVYRLIPSGHVIEQSGSSAFKLDGNDNLWQSKIGAYKLVINDDSQVGSQGLSAAITTSTSARFQLAYNPRTQQAVIITGLIIAKLESGFDASIIATDLSLTLSADYSHIGIAYYQPEFSGDLMGQVERLNSDPRILSAYLDVIENQALGR